MNVLSLFDGMSCGMIALERVGIKVDKYFSSEIDKNAIKVSKANYPEIIHIGDVNNIYYSDGTLYTEVGEFVVAIDLIIAGSPCQGFSMLGKKLAFGDARSVLYFKFEEVLRQCKPKYFLLENVKMKKEYKDIITERLGVKPIAINSNLVSAQNRYRLYWTNIQGVTPPEDKGIFLKNILQYSVDEKYYIKSGRLKWLQNFGGVKEKRGYVAFNPTKAKCLTVRGEPSWNTTYIIETTDGWSKDGVAETNVKPYDNTWEVTSLCLNGGRVRKLTPQECEELQTVPKNYTESVSDTQRYKMLGNGWTVDVVAGIFKNLKGT